MKISNHAERCKLSDQNVLILTDKKYIKPTLPSAKTCGHTNFVMVMSCSDNLI
jgi:hypothetical protein